MRQHRGQAKQPKHLRKRDRHEDNPNVAQERDKAPQLSLILDLGWGGQRALVRAIKASECSLQPFFLPRQHKNLLLGRVALGSQAILSQSKSGGSLLCF